jgi:hypothetical protein
MSDRFVLTLGVRARTNFSESKRASRSEENRLVLQTLRVYRVLV